MPATNTIRTMTEVPPDAPSRTLSLAWRALLIAVMIVWTVLVAFTGGPLWLLLEPIFVASIVAALVVIRSGTRKERLRAKFVLVPISVAAVAVLLPIPHWILFGFLIAIPFAEPAADHWLGRHPS